ncbi:MAG: GNAT family N-acetyltransferase [Acidimicrobiales bacterium]
MELRTERLILREFRLDDEAAVHRYGSDEEVTRYTTWGPNSPAETAAYLSEVARKASGETRTSFTLAVATLDDELIGATNLTITDAKSTGELGYVLARDSWGHGYATEVARRLIVFGFDELGLRRITATCHPDNLASARVLEKARMHFEGTIRDHLAVRGGWRDSRLFAIVADAEGAGHPD